MSNPIDELFNILVNEGRGQQKEQQKERPRKKARKAEEIQFRSQVFHGDEMILDHAQSDYTKVLKFTLGTLVELAGNGAKDYRIQIVDDKGNLRFFAIGEDTQVVDFKKV
jgi:hypothetical protein